MINDTQLYELLELRPVIIKADELPVKIMAKNGYHLSKTYFITQPSAEPIFIDIGCTIDNATLLGGVLMSVFFFVIFFATHLYPLLLLANFPILFIAYKFFFKQREFITVKYLSVPKTSRL